MGSSSWGANRLKMTWIDIENILFDKIFNYKSVAVSLGGDNDIAEELPNDIIKDLTEKILQQQQSNAKLSSTIDRRISNTNRNVNIIQLENKQIREKISHVENAPIPLKNM